MLEHTTVTISKEEINEAITQFLNSKGYTINKSDVRFMFGTSDCDGPGVPSPTLEAAAVTGQKV